MGGLFRFVTGAEGARAAHQWSFRAREPRLRNCGPDLLEVRGLDSVTFLTRTRASVTLITASTNRRE
jgi:hypothetical protein